MSTINEYNIYVLTTFDADFSQGPVYINETEFSLVPDTNEVFKYVTSADSTAVSVILAERFATETKPITVECLDYPSGVVIPGTSHIAEDPSRGPVIKAIYTFDNIIPAGTHIMLRVTSQAYSGQASFMFCNATIFYQEPE